MLMLLLMMMMMGKRNEDVCMMRSNQASFSQTHYPRHRISIRNCHILIAADSETSQASPMPAVGNDMTIMAPRAEE